MKHLPFALFMCVWAMSALLALTMSIGIIAVIILGIKWLLANT